MLVFDGIAEEQGENLPQGILYLLTRTLGLVVQPYDLDFARRMGEIEPGKIRPILVGFRSPTLRQNTYAGRMKLAKSTSKVYIREFLTPARAAMQFEARKLKRAGVIANQWTLDGEINVMKTKDSKPVIIRSIEHLNSFIRPPAGYPPNAPVVVTQAVPGPSNATLTNQEAVAEINRLNETIKNLQERIPAAPQGGNPWSMHP